VSLALVICVSGLRLAAADPKQYSTHGSYKIPPVLEPGSIVTIRIAPQARRFVVMSNPDSPPGGAVAATYHACANKRGSFPQSFVFTDGRIRGCVPLEVQIDRERRIRHAVLSLFDPPCRPRAAYG
jgi:hypothetical protein